MKKKYFTKRFKFIWWLSLLIIFTLIITALFLLKLKIEHCSDIIFIIWILLLVFPIFDKLKILGLSYDNKETKKKKKLHNFVFSNNIISILEKTKETANKIPGKSDVFQFNSDEILTKIEKEINRIWQLIFSTTQLDDEDIEDMLEDLSESKIIDDNTKNTIIIILDLCNLSIRLTLNDIQKNYLSKYSPEILKILNDIR